MMKKNILILLTLIIISCKPDNSKRENSNTRQTTSEEKSTLPIIKDSVNNNEVEGEKAMSNAALQYLELIPKLKAYQLKKGRKGKFPEFYGGSYISNTKEYIVMIKGDTSYYRKFLDSLTGTTNYKIKACKYSYNQLDKTMNLMNKKFKTIKNPNFHTWALDESENSILIGLDTLNPENIKKFKRDMGDYPFFTFEESSPIVDE